jgi:hypothetical protein
MTPAITDPMREALEFCEDVLRVAQLAYKCPDSPLINMARERAQAALAFAPDSAMRSAMRLIEKTASDQPNDIACELRLAAKLLERAWKSQQEAIEEPT